MDGLQGYDRLTNGNSSAMPKLTLTVNGHSWSGEVRAGTSLLDLLREQLHLTGAKLGCGEGLCGSCTVLVDSTAGRGLHHPGSDGGGRHRHND